MSFISKSLKKYSKTDCLSNKKCVFQTFNKLAQITHSINLGAGTPSGKPSSFITDAINKYSNQSNTPNPSLLTMPHAFNRQSFILNKKISSIYSGHHLTKLHPFQNIIVTTGAKQALASSLNVLLNQGDQAIIFDPSYESYRKGIQSVGAKAIGIPLIPKYIQSKEQIKLKGPNFESNEKDHWEIDFKKFRQSINDNTRVLLINSPQNPTGKIFTEEQLKEICKILEKFPRIIVIDDRVYQHSHYDSYLNKEVPKISNMTGLKNKTISIYSGGKLLRVEGLRCGWIIGPENIVNEINLIDPPPTLSNQLHLAISQSLQIIYATQNNYLKDMTKKLINSRKLLLNSLIESKYDFKLWIPEGGYFILVNIENINLPEKYYYDQNSTTRLSKDYAFCMKLCREDGVSSIPCSTFFDKQNISIGQNLVRFAFCKDDKQIIEAGKRLKG